MKSAFFGRFEQVISQKIADQVEYLVGGGGDDYSKVQYQRGLIAGLQQAIDIGKEVDAQQLGIPYASDRPAA